VVDPSRIRYPAAALTDRATAAFVLRPLGVLLLRAALALLPNAVEHAPNVRRLQRGEFDLAELRRQVQPHRDFVPDVGRGLARRCDNVLKPVVEPLGNGVAAHRRPDASVTPSPPSDD
jgi:hypothetical protein